MSHYPAASAEAVSFSPRGDMLAAIASDGSVHLLDIEKGEHLTALGSLNARDLAFSPDGRLLAVASGDDSLRLFEVPSAQPVGEYYWHMSSLNSVAFSPNGRWLVTSADDSYVKLWPVFAMAASPAKKTTRARKA